ncbi:MAG: Replicase polyprotein 1ab [Micromonosporaceae bacterium]
MPEGIDPGELHPDVRAELRTLSKPLAESVARRLIATGMLLAEDPPQALAHALAARQPASRIAAVREAVGIAAYHAGEWKLAISELRAYQRISGRQSHLALIADCERALGRPERAVDLYRAVDARQLDRAELTELLIVASGARRDLGQQDAALAMLQVPALRTDPAPPWVARLRYAFADQLLALGREGEAREWFQRAVDADPEGETGAAERLLELDGVVLDDADLDEAWPAEPDQDEAAQAEAGQDEAGQDETEPDLVSPDVAALDVAALDVAGVGVSRVGDGGLGQGGADVAAGAEPEAVESAADEGGAGVADGGVAGADVADAGEVEVGDHPEQVDPEGGSGRADPDVPDTVGASGVAPAEFSGGEPSGGQGDSGTAGPGGGDAAPREPGS